MNAVTPPRSAAIDALIVRTQHIAIFLPPIETADAGQFPPPYVADSRLADRMMRDLHDAPLGFNLCGLLVCFAFYVVVGIALFGMLWGAVQFVLWALDLFGRAA